MFKRLIAGLLCLTFSLSNLQYVQAQSFSVNQLPVPGTMIGESAAFAPLSLKGLVINPQKPLEFQFIVDTGNSNVIPAKAGIQNQEEFQVEATKLVKYFLAGLTIPEGELWVNLSPYEKNRITTLSLGQTILGRDLLAQDYILKQLTASLIYPEKDLGKEFWARVYAKAQQEFGTTNVPVNTFNKVWILPDEAQVYENGPAAYVTKATLKVMLDEDYLALQKHGIKDMSSPNALIGDPNTTNTSHSIASSIVREIVLPEIAKEVNTGKNFAPLRQIYDAMILAKWYKQTFENYLLDALYTNKNRTGGINLTDPTVKEAIYQRYLQAYKKGVFNYIKDDATPDGQYVPRKYFSGGIDRIEPAVVATNGVKLDVHWDGAMISLTVLALGATGGVLGAGLGVFRAKRQIAKQARDKEIGQETVRALISLNRALEQEKISNQRKITIREFPNAVNGAGNKDIRPSRFSRLSGGPLSIWEVTQPDAAMTTEAVNEFIERNNNLLSLPAQRSQTLEFLSNLLLYIEFAEQALEGRKFRGTGIISWSHFDGEVLIYKNLLMFMASQLHLAFQDKEGYYTLAYKHLGGVLSDSSKSEILTHARVLIYAHVRSVDSFNPAMSTPAAQNNPEMAIQKSNAQEVFSRYLQPSMSPKRRTRLWQILLSVGNVRYESLVAALQEGRIQDAYDLVARVLNAMQYRNLTEDQKILLNFFGGLERRLIEQGAQPDEAMTGTLAQSKSSDAAMMTWQQYWNAGDKEKREVLLDKLGVLVSLGSEENGAGLQNLYTNLYAFMSTGSDEYRHLVRGSLSRVSKQSWVGPSIFEAIDLLIWFFDTGSMFAKSRLENNFKALPFMPKPMQEIYASLLDFIRTCPDSLNGKGPAPGSSSASSDEWNDTIIDGSQLRKQGNFDAAMMEEASAPEWEYMDYVVDQEDFSFSPGTEIKITKDETIMRENKGSLVIVHRADKVLVTKEDGSILGALPKGVRRLYEGIGLTYTGRLEIENEEGHGLDVYYRKVSNQHDTAGKQDNAMNGGIDLNQIAIHRTGHVIPMQFDPAQLTQLEQGGFKGFTPVITGMRRLSSPFELLDTVAAK